jgi:hypothetical protein
MTLRINEFTVKFFFKTNKLYEPEFKTKIKRIKKYLIFIRQPGIIKTSKKNS